MPHDTKPAGGEIDVSKLSPPARRDTTAVREHDEAMAFQKIDGRTLRRVGRTEFISYKTFPEVKATMTRIAQAEGVSLIEVIEKGIELYDQLLKGKK